MSPELREADRTFFWVHEQLDRILGVTSRRDEDGDAPFYVKEVWGLNARFWLVYPSSESNYHFRRIFERGKVLLWFGPTHVLPTEGGDHIYIPDTSEQSLEKIQTFITHIRVLHQP
jgi:hypothetical protein